MDGDNLVENNENNQKNLSSDEVSLVEEQEKPQEKSDQTAEGTEEANNKTEEAEGTQGDSLQDQQVQETQEPQGQEETSTEDGRGAPRIHARGNPALPGPGNANGIYRNHEPSFGMYFKYIRGIHGRNWSYGGHYADTDIRKVFPSIGRRKEMNPISVITAYSVVELSQLFIASIPVGFLVGCFPMIVGIAILGLMNILKRA